MKNMRIHQIVGLLRTHPRLAIAAGYRPQKFLGTTEEAMPADFHKLHARLCLRRSQRRYKRYYRDGVFKPAELLTKELTHFPCGRKSLLYLAVRLLAPTQVVETGVWFGFSTSQILQAMADNGKGKLHSVDAPNVAYDAGPYFDAKPLPKGMETGFVIPTSLLEGWELVRGYSRDVLSPLLDIIRPIDIFFHDSQHTYENMLFEYRLAWEHLSQGGVLISDDAHLNEAFNDFCRETNASACSLMGYGVAVKA